jgi:hypothetical protein
LYLDELRYEQLYGDDGPMPPRPSPIYWRCKAISPGSLNSISRKTDKGAKDVHWAIWANQNIWQLADFYVSFKRFLNVAGRVAKRHNLIIDLEQARDGFPTILRRGREAGTGSVPDGPGTPRLA